MELIINSRFLVRDLRDGESLREEGARSLPLLQDNEEDGSECGYLSKPGILKSISLRLQQSGLVHLHNESCSWKFRQQLLRGAVEGGWVRRG